MIVGDFERRLSPFHFRDRKGHLLLAPWHLRDLVLALGDVAADDGGFRIQLSLVIQRQKGNPAALDRFAAIGDVAADRGRAAAAEARQKCEAQN